MIRVPSAFKEQLNNWQIENSICYLSNLTSWRVGGKAFVFFIDKEKQLSFLLPFLKKNQISYLTLGGGSNLLVSDQVLNAWVLKINLRQLEIKNQAKDFLTIRCQAGVPLQRLIYFLEKRGNKVFSKLKGIPGTVGGAVVNNTGAYGISISHYLKEIHYYINGEKNIDTVAKAEFNYRTSKYKNSNFKGVITELVFCFPWVENCCLNVISKRRKSQPQGFSCGSVFCNPAEGKAWQFIEMAGLKGAHEGYAVVSKKHANFIVNEGGKAKSKDIYNLVDKVKKTVKNKCQVELKEEFQYWGDFSKN